MMSMADVSSLIKDAGVLAKRAVENDQKEENYPVAIYFYVEATSILERAKYILDETIRNRDGIYSDAVIAENRRIAEAIQSKINEYRGRTIKLDKAVKSKEAEEMSKPIKIKSEQERLTDRAYFLVEQALQSDENNQDEEAVELYMQAVEMCLQALKQPSMDPKLASKINMIAKQAITRAEELKGVKNEPKVAKSNTEFFEDAPEMNRGLTSIPPKSPAISARNAGGVGPSSVNAVYSRGLGAGLGGPPPPSGPPGAGGYSDEEKKVLLTTSIINGREYVPFMSVDLQERFAYPLPFTDGGGKLHLSPKQRKNFKEWARPSDLYENPKMIEVVSCYSIKQTVISDCSFVASLAVSALYERRFNKRLITGIIYPQNPKTGDPVYNPCGKYMIKLHLNGVKRKVIIDDLLPVGQRGDLLCSYSSNKGELWVSLLEKAYMKVMGGYDFPGSNSNIDLHALTGWIPERVALHPQDGTGTFEKDKVFQMIEGRMAKGDVLVTVATGQMDESEADRAGLVTCHAYAVLDLQVVNGVKLLKLKNPWSHLRWKGNYSELDVIHWTDELQRVLNYDPHSASSFDNGVFWIDYDSLCKFFDVFYLNWNPKIFAHTHVVHKTWSAGQGPVKDVYNIGENPQYVLEVNGNGTAVVWVLLTRHITEIEDFKENREYITVLVYDTDGKRVFYPYDPPPIKDGVRINSPHYLCKITVPCSGVKRYTLVVSQYSKMNTIHYTLRSYSNFPTILKEIRIPFEVKKKVDGQWKGITAGGCQNHRETYPNNPCYQITLDSTAHLLIELKAPKTFQIGFDIVCSNVSDSKAPGFFNRKSSGSYRPGFVALELEQVPSGVYNIIPSTYLPNTEGHFFLIIQATTEISLKQVN